MCPWRSTCRAKTTQSTTKPLKTWACSWPHPTLPFATLGTLGWAHSDQALDDGSSQFFMFLYEAELTPAGLNLVDGRNAAFGYVVDGFDVLEELGVDDRITAVKVIEGAEQLKAHA